MKNIGRIVVVASLVFSSLAVADESGSQFHCVNSAAYESSLYARIRPRWKSFLADLQRAPPDPRYQNPTLAAKLVVAIEPDGKVTSIERDDSSRLGGYDRAPVDIFTELGRLPPPPPSCRSDDGRVYLEWRFARGKEGCEHHQIIERKLLIEQAIPVLVQSGREAEAAARVSSLWNTDRDLARRMTTLMARWISRMNVKSEVAERRVVAASALATVPEGESMLLDLLGDQVGRVHRTAMMSLGVRPRSDSALGALLPLAATDELPLVARVLQQLGDRRAIDVLRKALIAGRAPAQVTQALLSLGDRDHATIITKLLLIGGEANQMSGVLAARVLAEPSLGAVLLALLPTTNGELEAQIIRAASAPEGNMDPDLLPAFLDVFSRGLNSPDAGVREAAAVAVLTVRDRHAVTLMRLADHLNDPEESVRVPVVEAVVTLSGEKIKDELWGRLADSSPRVRIALGTTLAAHPFDGAGPFLRRLMKDADPDVASTVLHAVATSTEARTLLGKTAPPVEARRAPDPALPRAPLEEERQLATRVLTAPEMEGRMQAAGEWLTSHSVAAHPVLEASNRF